LAGWTPQTAWNTIRRTRLIRVLAVYAGASFVVLEAVDIFTQQIGLPDWFFPGAVALLLIGLPIIVATALVQGAPAQTSGAESLSLGEPLPELSDPTTAAEVAAVAKHWLTWKKAIVGGVLAFALLGVIVTGYMAMRVLGIGPVGSLVAAGVLDERERIILADFQSQTGDTLLAAAATEAFRIDLAQSPLVTLVDPTHVGQVLRRMQREPTARLDLALAREVAIRDSDKAVIAGEINNAGLGFVLSAQLVSAPTGEILASYRETANDSAAIIGAIDRLSKKLRERIGESLVTIRGNERLESVTTSSLEALRKYSQAVRAIGTEGDSDKGIALLEEAVALDSTFAMAWRKLGAESGNRGETDRSVQALRNAFKYRERLTDRERYLTVATYHTGVTGERDKSIIALSTLLDTYPDDPWALVRLGIEYAELRDYEQAEQLQLRAIAAAPYSLFGYFNAIVAQVALGKAAEAETTLVHFAENLPGNPIVPNARGLMAAARGDYSSAEAAILELQRDWGRSLGWRSAASNSLAALARIRGRLADAERHSMEAMATGEQRRRPADYLAGALDVAGADLWFLGRTESAMARVEAALERYPLQSIAPVERPYLRLASFYALAEEADRARALLSEYEAAVAPELRHRAEGELHRTRGDLALAEGRLDETIPEYRLGDQGLCAMCAGFPLGRAYDISGEPDSAISNYERYVTDHSILEVFPHSWQLAPAYERLGTLYEQRGDTQKAIYYYNKLVELWANADPELQPRVDAARRAIAALSTDR
jgi:tetratricopeptide (TPR) repeat protein